MDYTEPQPVEQYANHAEYSEAYRQASKKAVDGFSRFVNPFDDYQKDKKLFSTENALLVAANIAMRGQGDVIKSSINSVVDAGVSISDHISSADVVPVSNQELGESANISNQDKLSALKDVTEYLDYEGNEQNKKRFDDSISYGQNCLDKNGYVDVQDPSVKLNESVDNSFFNDVRIAGGISNVATAAVTISTGFIGGVAASYLIDDQKEKYVNNSRMDKYIESTENMLSTCKNFESSGTLYENGKIVSMNKSTSENGNDYTEVKINYNNDGVVSGMDIVKTQKNNSAIIPDSQSKIFDEFASEMKTSKENQTLQHLAKLSR